MKREISRDDGRRFKLVTPAAEYSRIRTGLLTAGLMHFGYGEIAVGGALFLMLVFGTGTVFVKAAWALQSFEMGICATVAVYLFAGIWWEGEFLSKKWVAWLVYAMPLWGMVQIVTHTTSSRFETKEETLRLGALAGVFFLSEVVCRSRVRRLYFLHGFLCFATGMAVLCLTQLFTSEGRVLWIFSTGYPDVYATFPNQNNYAQFVELALPVALWHAAKQGWRAWWYPLAAGILYASAIGSASRTGAVLCTAELVAVPGIELVRQWREKEAGFARKSIAMLVAIPVLAAVFTFAVGWQRLSDRFREMTPDSTRAAFLAAAVKMAEHKPLTGYGLGTFPRVYQSYAVRDFPFYANHVHNDWAEFAADGGIPFLLLMLIPFAAAVPGCIRHGWALGLLAVMLHACVDFPFPRPAVSGWIYALLGALSMARLAEKHRGDVAPLRAEANAGRHRKS